MNITADSAMKWAFQRGTTTRPGGAGGGLGLDLLKELVKANKGRLDIFSHEGHAAIIGDVEFYDTRSVFFEGTLVTISLRCDANYYMLASEVPDQKLF
jgi:signal transduction histidine kinase